MSKQILSELKLLRAALVHLIGSSGLPEALQLSPEVLDKASEDFKKLRKMSDQWMGNYELSEYFKIHRYDGHDVGHFIIKEFKFSNYFKQGRSYYFNKADVVSLAKELKARNVNLARYIEFKSEEAQFTKHIEEAFNNKEANKNMPYWLSEIVQDVDITDPPRPTVEIVLTDIIQLREEFHKYKLGDYIDVYQGKYAMMKIEYNFKKYITADIQKQCKKWCQNFNYALNALTILDKKKASSITMTNDEDMIEL